MTVNTDVRCPHCREMTNVHCWKCGWVRDPDERAQALRQAGVQDSHAPSVPRGLTESDDGSRTWMLDEFKDWGRSIEQLGENLYVGWSNPHPKIGDTFETGSPDGTRTVLKVVAVRRPPLEDPGDQWFANCAPTTKGGPDGR